LSADVLLINCLINFMRIPFVFRVCPVLLLAASCAVGPDYKAPVASQIAPAEWHWKVAEPKDAAPKGDWWNLFNDPALTSLETNAVAHNLDLRAAVARVDESRASARMTRSQFFPELSLDPSFQRQRVSGNEPIPFNFHISPVYLNTFSVPLDLSYEVDLWGRVRRSFESARAQAQASVADEQNVLLTLTSDVAVNYFLLRSLDAETALLERTVQSRTDTVRILNERFMAGSIPEIDKAREETELATARVELADTGRQRAQTLDALAVLCGQPASTFSVAAGPSVETPPLAPVGLPSSVLERRPDVAEAERQLQARNAEIGVAKAAYFPVVHLTGQAGYLSGEAKNLFTMDSMTFSLGPSVSLPIFTAGRTTAQVRQAEASYREALANYQKTALTAFQEVEDSLAQIHFYNDQSAAQFDALKSAKRVEELTKARSDAGVLTAFEVEDAERLALEEERQTTQLTAQRFAATVRLIKALGGGWQQP
jgi:outer membrane protein, multidrug efflux system